MLRLIVILSIIVFPAAGHAQFEKAVPTAQAMANTFNIYGDKLTGSGFMVNVGGSQYFVTAAHLFAASHRSAENVSLQMVIQNQLQTYSGKIYFHSDRKVDIAVLKLSETIEQNLTLPEDAVKYSDTIKKVFRGDGFSLDNVFVAVGMESYFMGFPLGNLGTEVFGIKFPLVKKAILSGTVRNNGVEVILLDGHNNLGFSGGPVVIYDEEKKTMRLVGVISGYLPEPVDVRNKNETLSVLENSGIIVCYGSQYIMEIFKRYNLH
jgi:S1-C subfamily serine protease